MFIYSTVQNLCNYKHREVPSDVDPPCIHCTIWKAVGSIFSMTVIPQCNTMHYKQTRTEKTNIINYGLDSPEPGPQHY